MASMIVEREIKAPPDVVWSIITDLDRSAQAMSGIKAIERIGDSTGFDVGTRWQETRELFGRETEETLEVAAIEPGRSYTVTAQSHGVEYVSVLSVDEAGAGSRLQMSFEGRATSVAARIGAVFGRFFEGSTRKMLQRDLDDIAAAAESAASAAADEKREG